jgi:broad specificity phosphatase PhoE
MKKLFLVRHGESTSNVNKLILRDTPNHLVSLTEKGRKQAQEAGKTLQRSVILHASPYFDFIVSPYVRTVQTYNEIVDAIYGNNQKKRPIECTYKEDFRIREIDIGNFIEDFESIRQDRLKIGKFHYRFPNGESGADLVLRVEQFLDKNLSKFQEYYPTVIVTHAGTINAFRMLLENLTVSQFDNLTKPENGSILEYNL